MAEIAGLKLIVPSSVAGSGVSVSASGKVTFTTATAVSVNGCFTSSHDNYLIVVRYKMSDLRNLSMRLRLSGTDATASNYTYQWLRADGANVTGQRGTLGEFVVGDSGTAESGDHIYVYGPNLAQPTATRNVNVSSRSSARLFDFACTHSLSTAYDGFTLFTDGTVTLTGACTVYGLAQ